LVVGLENSIAIEEEKEENSMSQASSHSYLVVRHEASVSQAGSLSLL
jgi:hypothetical protein